VIDLSAKLDMALKMVALTGSKKEKFREGKAKTKDNSKLTHELLPICWSQDTHSRIFFY
jgi:hypothetical protein